MSLKLITPMSSPLVTTAEAKRHVHAEDFADDDAYLDALVEVATEHISAPSGWSGRLLGEQQWELRLDKFPADKICMPFPPLQSVDSIKYIDIDGDEQTITDFREFGIDSARGVGFVLPAYDTEWPQTREEPEAVRITFTAGYTSAPKAAKHAILLLVGQWYDRRENASEIKMTDMPSGVAALVETFRHYGSAQGY
jgi:uncharacterized phiE125 gp8 family phage protein